MAVLYSLVSNVSALSMGLMVKGARHVEDASNHCHGSAQHITLQNGLTCVFVKQRCQKKAHSGVDSSLKSFFDMRRGELMKGFVQDKFG